MSYEYVGEHDPEVLEDLGDTFQSVVARSLNQGVEFPRSEGAERFLFQALDVFALAHAPEILGGANLTLEEIVGLVSAKESGLTEDKVWTMISRIALAEALEVDGNFDEIFSKTTDLVVSIGPHGSKGIHVHDGENSPCMYGFDQLNKKIDY